LNLNTSSNGYGFYLENNTAWVSLSNFGFASVNTSNPSGLQVIQAATRLGRMTNDIAVAANTIFHAQFFAFEVYDRDTLNLVKTVDLSADIKKLELLSASSELLVIGGNNEVHRFDISQANAPVLIGKQHMRAKINAVQSHRGYLYAATDKGVEIYHDDSAQIVLSQDYQQANQSPLVYEVQWPYESIENQEVKCWVSGGTCSQSSSMPGQITITWNTPATPGDYEIKVGVGNTQHFIIDSDRIIVQ
ncbi:MAG: hypothetical protein OEY38_23745, partial [Gammaproteobacteria bacterium]|nr:hypothetical protein [Gammaproteobacteria bacterium]